GLRVVAELEAVDRSGGEADDVLRRRAQLDADDVRIHVRAEHARVDRMLQLPGEVAVLARDDRGSWEADGDLLRHVRPGEDGDGPAAPAGREPPAGGGIEPLR